MRKGLYNVAIVEYPCNRAIHQTGHSNFFELTLLKSSNHVSSYCLTNLYQIVWLGLVDTRANSAVTNIGLLGVFVVAWTKFVSLVFGMDLY